MCTDITISTFDVLREFHSCNISLTFNNENQVPLVSVCFKNNLYEIKFLNTNTTKTYVDVESAIKAINETMSVNVKASEPV